VWGSGCGAWVEGFGVWGLGVWGLVCGVRGVGFGLRGLGLESTIPAARATAALLLLFFITIKPRVE